MFAERIDPKAPLPGGEEKLRDLLEGIRARTPDYEDMDPKFAQLIERNLARLYATSVRFGAIRSVIFLKALSPGLDIDELLLATHPEFKAPPAGPDGSDQHEKPALVEQLVGLLARP